MRVSTTPPAARSTDALSAQLPLGAGATSTACCCPPTGYTLSLQAALGRALQLDRAERPVRARLRPRYTLYQPLGARVVRQARVELGQVFARDIGRRARHAAVPRRRRRLGARLRLPHARARWSTARSPAAACCSPAASRSRARSRRSCPSLWWAVFVDAGNAADRWSDLKPGARLRRRPALAQPGRPAARRPGLRRGGAQGAPALQRGHRVLSAMDSTPSRRTARSRRRWLRWLLALLAGRARRWPVAALVLWLLRTEAGTRLAAGARCPALQVSGVRRARCSATWRRSASRSRCRAAARCVHRRRCRGAGCASSSAAAVAAAHRASSGCTAARVDLRPGAPAAARRRRRPPTLRAAGRAGDRRAAGRRAAGRAAGRRRRCASCAPACTSAPSGGAHAPHRRAVARLRPAARQRQRARSAPTRRCRCRPRLALAQDGALANAALVGPAPRWPARWPRRRLQATLRAAAGVGAGRRRRPAQSLDLTATLRPFAAWPLGDAGGAARRALDLSAFHRAAPATALSGTRQRQQPGARPAGAGAARRWTTPSRAAGTRAGCRCAGCELELRAPARRPVAARAAARFDAELGTPQQPAGRLQGQGRWARERLARWRPTLQALQPARLDARAAGHAARRPAHARRQPAWRRRRRRSTAQADLAGRVSRPRAAGERCACSSMAAGAAKRGAERIELRECAGHCRRRPRDAVGPARAARRRTRAWQLKGQAALADFDPALWWPRPRGLALAPRAAPAERARRARPRAAASAAAAARRWIALARAARRGARSSVTDSLLAGVPLRGELGLRSAAAGAAAGHACRLDAGRQPRSTPTGRIAAAPARDDRWELTLDAPALASARAAGAPAQRGPGRARAGRRAHRQRCRPAAAGRR